MSLQGEVLWPEAGCICTPWQLYLSLWMKKLTFGLFGCFLPVSEDRHDQFRGSEEVEFLNQ